MLVVYSIRYTPARWRTTRSSLDVINARDSGMSVSTAKHCKTFAGIVAKKATDSGTVPISKRNLYVVTALELKRAFKKPNIQFLVRTARPSSESKKGPSLASYNDD